MTGTALYARLNSEVAAVGGRIYPHSAPPRIKTYPMVVYSGNGPSHLVGDDSTYRETVDIAILSASATSDEVNTIADAIRTALHGQRGVWGGVNVERVLHADGGDGYLKRVADDTTQYWIIEQTYTVWIHTA